MSHAADWERAIRQGDRSRARSLYEEFGGVLRDEMREEGGRPVLSDPATNRLIRKRLAEIGIREGRALDLGCGPTPVAAMSLAEFGLEAVGVDVAHSICSIAKNTATGVGVAVADAELLPFRDGAFDLVTCDDTIEHIFDQEVAAAELGRVMRGGGRLLIVTPNASGLHVQLARLRDLLRRERKPRVAYHITQSHVRELRWFELIRMLRPWFKLAGAMPIGFGSRGGRARLMGRMVRLPGMWRFGRTLFVEFERRGAQPRSRPDSAREHYAQLDDPDSQTSPRCVQAGLKRWMSRASPVGPVLDLGTGQGDNLRRLAEHSWAVGLDVSLPAARQARLTGPVVVADAAKLPFRDGSLGAVVCTEVLEHVDNPKAVLGEVSRVLSPSGEVYITTPNYANMAGAHKLLRDTRTGRKDWNPWGAHEGGYEAFMTGRRLWRSAKQWFELSSVRGLDYGQAMTGRFRLLDRLAWSRGGRAALRRLLPRLEGSGGPLGWLGMHTELVMRKRGTPTQRTPAQHKVK
jgi:ubiquinone/menaquinone biosynthesis C-methylase UbiE